MRARLKFPALAMGLLAIGLASGWAVTTFAAGNPTEQQPSGPTGEEPIDAAAIGQLAEGYLDTYERALRIAAGEKVDCPEPCARDEDPTRVMESLAGHCMKVGWAELASDQRLARAESLPLLMRLAGACDAIIGSQTSGVLPGDAARAALRDLALSR